MANAELTKHHKKKKKKKEPQIKTHGHRTTELKNQFRKPQTHNPNRSTTLRGKGKKKRERSGRAEQREERV